MRRKEKPLKEQPVTVSVRADFVAERRRRETVADSFDILLFADDVSARGRETAAGIFDERTRGDIRPNVARFFFFDEFAVAIIDENNPFEAVRADKRTDLADLRHGGRGSEFVPAGTQDINNFKIIPRVLQAIFKCGKIYGAFGV